MHRAMHACTDIVSDHQTLAVHTVAAPSRCRPASLLVNMPLNLLEMERCLRMVGASRLLGPACVRHVGPSQQDPTHPCNNSACKQRASQRRSSAGAVIGVSGKPSQGRGLHCSRRLRANTWLWQAEEYLRMSC